MPEEAPTLDLSAFDFRPAWAKEPGAAPASREPREERREAEAPRDRRPAGFGPKRGGPPRQGSFRGPRDRGKPAGPRREELPPAPPNPFPWLRIAFTATAPAVETVAAQVRQTGKTFSLFDIARILLRNPASYTIDLSSAPKQAEGPFYAVEGDRSFWLTREAAVRHLLRGKLGDFYRAETVEIEPPKGNFPVVAVCGMSGALLGPPNHHDFERRLRELHRERFSRMDFETFRSRLKMERNQEVIDRWRAEASKVTEYYPREGENAEKLADLAAVERHFSEHHAPALVKLVEVAAVPGDPKMTSVDAALAPLLNHARAEEERFPLRLAQSLSRALTAAGLRFYKSANRTTFVSATRPRHLNLEEVAVSDSIRKILETIRGRKSIRRNQLLDLLAPAPSPGTEPTPDPSRDALVNDLLWLTHEGYVVEYADGRLESVPPPKHPPKPAAPPAETVVPPDASSTAVSDAPPGS